MPATTIMNDSQIGDEWIREMVRLNPIQYVIDPTTGKPNGNILTCPVRLNWVSLDAPRKVKQKQPNGTEILVDGKFEAQLLFPSIADTTILAEAYNAACATHCQDFFNPQIGQYVGLNSPFLDQTTKTVGKNTKGYTPNSLMLNVSSNFKPPVCDPRLNPIVDPKKIYPGVWALVSMNTYASGIKTNQPKKGIRFGIISVMIIADDESLANGGAAADPRTEFSGVNVKPPAMQPTAMFGQMAAQMPGMPGAMPNTNAQFVTPPAPVAPSPLDQAPSMVGAAPMQNFVPAHPAPAASAMKNCWQCAKPMPQSFAVCPHCHMPQE